MDSSKKLDFIRFYDTSFHFAIANALLVNLFKGNTTFEEILEYVYFYPN